MLLTRLARSPPAVLIKVAVSTTRHVQISQLSSYHLQLLSPELTESLHMGRTQPDGDNIKTRKATHNNEAEGLALSAYQVTTLQSSG